MDKISKVKAFAVAQAVVVARAGNTAIVPNQKAGEELGDFFNAFYQKILKTSEEVFKD